MLEIKWNERKNELREVEGRNIDGLQEHSLSLGVEKALVSLEKKKTRRTRNDPGVISPGP